MKQTKGSITIFSLLALLLITGTLFALIEGTRFQEMGRFAQLQTESALESAFANYNSCLWETYHLLGTDFSQIGPILEETANGRNGESGNFLKMKLEEVQMGPYTRLTDHGGKVFIKSVSAYMEEYLLYEAAKEIYNQFEASKSIMDSDDMKMENIDDALGELQNMELPKEGKAVRSVDAKFQNAQKTQEPQNLQWSQNTQESVNPQASKESKEAESILEAAKKLKEMGILELLLEDSSKVSSRQQDFTNGLLKRSLEQGNSKESPTIDWKDQVLLQQYLLRYMSNFRDNKTDQALGYEVEFLIAGKDSDVENLKAVANRLLLIRESVNFLYLISNPQKAMPAEEMAILIAGASANPILIEVVKIGLLTAWALAESVLDVRAILDGKRVALLKSEDTWTTELDEIKTLTREFAMAKENPLGLSYEDYLGILLLFESPEDLAMGAMNLQEATIRKITENTSFYMDKLVTQAQVKMTYSYHCVFPFLQVVNAHNRWEYKVSGAASYGYY